ncbi:alanine--glyoxylate aminotransferase family protein [Bacillus carboniphilus]|uniref:Alanine--glyoxylate aminotransferase family protein n=1 Tax=Bacillus carboniphilus TaxID=86663 RepID=A0ABN0VXZ8_9BACI
MLSDQQFLRIPGPTPIPPSVQRAILQPMIGHRDEETKMLLQTIRPRLKPIFGTEQEVLILAGSGTSGLETAVVNTTQPHDEVLVLVTGAFGERFAQICEAHQLVTHRMEAPPGEAIAPEHVKAFLSANPSIKVVFATFCETSTAVLNPIQELAQVVQQNSDALLVVDGVSCVGGVETKMDDWGIDVLVTGSQKALMLPPGLTFIAVSDRAWDRVHHNPRPRFYFDLKKYHDNLVKDSTPFTPAVSLLFGLDQVLNLVEEEGVKQVFTRHQLMMKMTRSACHALQLPLLTTDQSASPTVTAVYPRDFQANELRHVLLKEFGLNLAGGQQELKNKIFRIGHMGYCSLADVLQTISLLELGLARLGVGREAGVGSAAAQLTFLNGGKTE